MSANIWASQITSASKSSASSKRIDHFNTGGRTGRAVCAYTPKAKWQGRALNRLAALLGSDQCYVTALMGSHKFSAQVERFEVIETGRRCRRTDNEKLEIVLESCRPRELLSF